MGSITKITTNSIKDGEVKTADINDIAVTTVKLADDAVTSAKINDGVVSGDHLSSTLDLSSKTLWVSFWRQTELQLHQLRGLHYHYQHLQRLSLVLIYPNQCK